MSNTYGGTHPLEAATEYGPMYPEVTTHSTLEVASHSNSTAALYSNPEAASESYPEVVSQYEKDSKHSYSPVPSPGRDTVHGYSKGDYSAAIELGEPSPRVHVTQPPAPSISLWQRRRWLILGAIAVVLIIALVAGVVGGVVGSKSVNNTTRSASSNSTLVPGPDGSSPSSFGSSSVSGSGSSSSSGSGTNTATGVATSTTATGSSTPVPVAISSPIALAAGANTNSAGTVSIAVFYQQSTSSDVMYTLYTRGHGFTVTNKATLSLPVAAGSPMALTSRLNTQNSQTVLDLFYRYVDGDTTHIAMSELVCDSGVPVCIESISGIITANTTHKVHPQSNVAAIWIGQGSMTGRVYYQDEDGSIIEASSDGIATAGWTTGPVYYGGAIGTSIAATFSSTGPKIQVIYVDSATGNPTELTYSSSWSAATVDANPGMKWSANATMTMCYVPTTGYFHWFYVSPCNGGNIVEYRRQQSLSTWSIMGTSSNLLTAQSGLGVVGWSNTMRLYHLHGTSLEQASASTGDWKTAEMKGSS